MDLNRANIGCGPDIKEGWVNIDSKYPSLGVKLWDITTPPDNNDPEYDFVERFDFILLNCVLCTMNDWSAHKALINLHRCLKPGGTLQVIDMDLLKVFKSYEDKRIEDIPINEGSIDARLCYAVSGYGTRLSVYTHNRVQEILAEAGFRIIKSLEESEFDTRPKESLVVEAIK